MARPDPPGGGRNHSTFIKTLKLNKHVKRMLRAVEELRK